MTSTTTEPPSHEHPCQDLPKRHGSFVLTSESHSILGDKRHVTIVSHTTTTTVSTDRDEWFRSGRYLKPRPSSLPRVCMYIWCVCMSVVSLHPSTTPGSPSMSYSSLVLPTMYQCPRLDVLETFSPYKILRLRYHTRGSREF